MKGEAIYKVPDGKLVRLSLELESDKISSVKIHGDFFMHPEDGIEAIEKALEGAQMGKELEAVIAQAIEANSIEMFGLNTKALAQAIKIAGENAK